MRYALLITLLCSCGEPTDEDDAGHDARVDLDASPPDDGGMSDGGMSDGGMSDGGMSDGGMSDGGMSDAGVDASTCTTIDCIAAPRPIAPLSTSTVTSQRPTFRWELPAGADGVGIEIYSDRACTAPILGELAPGSSYRPIAPLAPGVYFWRLRAVIGLTTATETSPVWQLRVGARDSSTDTSWDAAVDVDGDGYEDALVGVYGDDAMEVYRGGADGIATTSSQTLSEGILTTGWGIPIASAGDLNGDGFGDVAVGAIIPTMSTLAGGDSVHVFFGGASGLGETPVDLRSPELSSRFGAAIASAGDVNGDGYADLAIGASDSGRTGMPRNGEVFVYHGGPGGIASSFATRLTPEATVDFGAALASAYFDADGYGDLAVGSVGVLSLHVYRGGASGLSTTPTIVPAVAGIGAGNLATADVDGDGYADLVVVGLEDRTTVVTLVFRGGPAGISTTSSTRIVHSTTEGEGAYMTARGAGDVNGDGYGDVAVGLPFANGQQGFVFLHLGSAGGLITTPHETFTNIDDGGFRAGMSIAAGDLDRDGYSDLFIGAEDLLATIDLPFYAGGPSGPSDTPTWRITSPYGRGAHFSTAVE
jgi:hypothetical protein